MSYPIQLLVSNLDDFRDSLPSSGVFDLMDCKVVVETNLDMPIKTMDRYLAVLNSCVNVVDVEFTSRAGSELSDDDLLITVYEIPVHIAENRPPFAKGQVTKIPRAKRSRMLPPELDEDGLDN